MSEDAMKADQAHSQSLSTFRCVHCGYPLPDLYTDFGNGVIRMTDCLECRQVGDPYIEVDMIHLFLDVVLQKEAVYRHAIFNSRSNVLDRSLMSLLRLLVALVFLDAYARWALVETATAEYKQSRNDMSLTFMFASTLLLSAVSVSAYLSILTLLASRFYDQDFRSVFHGVLLSMLGILFNILLLTWSSDFWLRIGIQSLIYVSNLVALKVITNRSGYWAPCMLVCIAGGVRYLCVATCWVILFQNRPSVMDLLS